jgi:ribosomal 50S subunit-associated protein YjgA (DUF615 family)
MQREREFLATAVHALEAARKNVVRCADLNAVMLHYPDASAAALRELANTHDRRECSCPRTTST